TGQPSTCSVTARSRAVADGTRAGSSGISRRKVPTILNLPGVIQHVPGNPTRGVASWPGFGFRGGLRRRPAQSGQDGLAGGLDRRAIAHRRRLYAHPDLAAIRVLGAEHVLDDLVA